MPSAPRGLQRFQPPGPWQHRLVSANGCQFHVAEGGKGPLVVLLHGFGEMWWAWHQQIPALADAGYRVAAVDLRGAGASDKPPTGYDPLTLCEDVAAIIRSLGAPRAHIVGHGIGGLIAWSMRALHPAVTESVVAISAPHPLALKRASISDKEQIRANSWLLRVQRPAAEKWLSQGSPALRPLIRRWSASKDAPDASAIAMYGESLMGSFSASAAVRTLRGFIYAPVTPSGQRLSKALRHEDAAAAGGEVLVISGVQDACVLPSTMRRSAEFSAAQVRLTELPDVGHFPHEEAPAAVSEALIEWLGSRA